MNEGIQYIGKMMVMTGIILAAAGGLLMLGSRISWIGRLPGDVLIQKKNFTFFFPLGTSILLSLLLSLIFWLLGKR